MPDQPTVEAALFEAGLADPLDVQEVGRETRDGASVHDITFAGPGGRRVTAYQVAPAEAPPAPHPGIVWVHWLEPKAPDSNRTQFLPEAVTLARQGVTSILPDAFWSVTPAKAAAMRQFGWRGEFVHDRDVTVRQVIALRRALDALLAAPGVDPARIAYVGHDFGAMCGALVAAVDRRPACYVLMAGTYSFGDWYVFGSDLDAEQEKAYQEQISVLDPTRYINRAAPARLYFQFAHADYYVPERAAQVFYDAASEPKEIAWYQAGHDLHDLEKDARADRLAWLRRQLGLPPA